MEGGCKTTTLDSFVYTWDTPDNCVMTKIFTQDAIMLHYPLTTDQKQNQFFFLREFNDTGEGGKGKNIKLKVFPEIYELCGKTESLCKTSVDSNFMNYQGGFAMPSGELRTKEHSSNAYQFLIDNTSQVFYTSLGFSEVNGKLVGAQPSRSVGADEID